MAQKKGSNKHATGKPQPQNKRGACGTILMAFIVLCVVIALATGGNKKSDESSSATSASFATESSAADGTLVETASGETEVIADATTSETSAEADSEAGPSEDLFSGDDSVDLLLNKWNEANPEEPIAAGDFTVYQHHGSDHTNQGINYDHNGFEEVITDGSEVYIQVYDTEKTYDEVKTESAKWIRAFRPNATEEEINSAWKTMEDDLTHNVTINGGALDGLKLDVNMNNNAIAYLTITG